MSGVFRGVDHVGVGVADMDAAVAFYGRVGFGETVFDHTGEVPGPDGARRARVVMLANPGATPVGPGRIKLVQVLDGDGTPPAPAGGGWGELGICELCLHARGVPEVHRALVAAGARSLMEPLGAAVQPNDVSLDIAYVTDPWGGKLELIEWTGLWRSLPGPPRAEGVNHVAFGVADLERTRAFYGALGFGELLFESTELFEPMAPWYPGDPPGQHMLMLLAPQGAGIEPVVLDPPGPDCRGAWGHAGPFEFAVGVSNLERGLARLRDLGAEPKGEPVTIDLGGGREWRYAYFRDPDDLYVSLVEPRY
ncbi:MAG TPA: VOC family protein [Gaiellaceae bacterium]|nr:VOC family protein [Gaiellaceae bacterium]